MRIFIHESTSRELKNGNANIMVTISIAGIEQLNNIIARLKKKTLVIVHKEFLMNQWIERIELFLPDAKIGKIQGQIVDVDDKDIVIGMLQSLSMKEYPASVFESFGLTIIDEVHHISSEVFSNSLFKYCSKMVFSKTSLTLTI